MGVCMVAKSLNVVIHADRRSIMRFDLLRESIEPRKGGRLFTLAVQEDNSGWFGQQLH